MQLFVIRKNCAWIEELIERLKLKESDQGDIKWLFKAKRFHKKY